MGGLFHAETLIAQEYQANNLQSKQVWTRYSPEQLVSPSLF